MKSIDLKSLALGLLIGATAVLGIAATNEPKNSATEYRVVVGSVYDGQFQKVLNNAAAEGWELHVSDSAGTDNRFAYGVMRRPKQQ